MEPDAIVPGSAESAALAAHNAAERAEQAETRAKLFALSAQDAERAAFAFGVAACIAAYLVMKIAQRMLTDD